MINPRKNKIIMTNMLSNRLSMKNLETIMKNGKSVKNEIIPLYSNMGKNLPNHFASEMLPLFSSFPR